MTSTQDKPQLGNGSEAQVSAQDSAIDLRLTLNEARVLAEIAKRGLLATGKGSAPGNLSEAKAALGKLETGISEARILLVRAELTLAGLAAAHLGDQQVTALARRLAEIG